jgi:hypothetical protein
MGEEAGAPTAASCHGSVMREISRLFNKTYDAIKVEPGGIVGIFKTKDGKYIASPLVKEDQGEEDMDKAGS